MQFSTGSFWGLSIILKREKTHLGPGLDPQWIRAWVCSKLTFKKKKKILWVLFRRNVTMATSEGSCRKDGEKKRPWDWFLPPTKEERPIFFILFYSLDGQLLKVASGCHSQNSPLLISNFSLWNLTKRRESVFFFSFNQQQDLQMKIWPMAELASHQSPEVSSIICQMWNLYFCTQSLRWCKNTVKLMCDSPNKKSFFFFFSVSSGPGVIRLESHHNGDLRGNCQRVWDGVTNSPLILMTGKSTEARTCCARTSVSWEAWVINWTLKVRLWSSKTS